MLMRLRLFVSGLAVMALGCLAQPVALTVDFGRPDGRWDMPALALGQGGLQSDPMIQPHIKELKQLRPRTIRLFLDEYYRIYPAKERYDFSKLDPELRAIRATGARPVLAIAIKPPPLYPKVDHAIVHPTDYAEWERLIEAIVRHCLEERFEVAAWEVSNEPDIGESGGTPYMFQPKDYVTYYDHTVQAILRVDPKATVGGPAVAYADSPIVTALIEHCATKPLPLHFLSWHLYSDSVEAHVGNITKQRTKLAKFPQLKDTRLAITEWNMDLMRPNLNAGFQPAFVLETQRRFAEAKLDWAAYYHIRDCFVDPADFDWMSPGGRRFMAHWWNTQPQYSALFDHHGRVRPAWYAFRLLGQLEGPRYPVNGEERAIRAISGDGDGRKHVIVWRYESGGSPEVEVTVSFQNAPKSPFRVAAIEADAPVNNLRVLRFSHVNDLAKEPIKLSLRPWDIRWIEIE
jgi:xylan 1,4-beta-xylosidase